MPITLIAQYEPGAEVFVAGIEMRVITVEFEWGRTFPRYECEWFHDGILQTRWFHEPDVQNPTDKWEPI